MNVELMCFWRSNDWEPLLNALKLNKGLINITFKSYYSSEDESGKLRIKFKKNIFFFCYWLIIVI